MEYWNAATVSSSHFAGFGMRVAGGPLEGGAIVGWSKSSAGGAAQSWQITAALWASETGGRSRVG